MPPEAIAAEGLEAMRLQAARHNTEEAGGDLAARTGCARGGQRCRLEPAPGGIPLLFLQEDLPDSDAEECWDGGPGDARAPCTGACQQAATQGAVSAAAEASPGRAPDAAPCTSSSGQARAPEQPSAAQQQVGARRGLVPASARQPSPVKGGGRAAKRGGALSVSPSATDCAAKRACADGVRGGGSHASADGEFEQESLPDSDARSSDLGTDCELSSGSDFDEDNPAVAELRLQLLARRPCSLAERGASSSPLGNGPADVRGRAAEGHARTTAGGAEGRVQLRPGMRDAPDRRPGTNDAGSGVAVSAERGGADGSSSGGLTGARAAAAAPSAVISADDGNRAATPGPAAAGSDAELLVDGVVTLWARRDDGEILRAGLIQAKGKVSPEDFQKLAAAMGPSPDGVSRTASQVAARYAWLLSRLERRRQLAGRA
jgi:hypothetical protein